MTNKVDKSYPITVLTPMFIIGGIIFLAVLVPSGFDNFPDYIAWTAVVLLLGIVYMILGICCLFLLINHRDQLKWKMPNFHHKQEDEMF